MIVGITGGKGFIGRHLVLRNLALGNTVKVLTRNPYNKNLYLPDSVHLYQADLTGRADDLIPFLEGVDVLYHCAGELLNTSKMYDVHVKGTRNLIEASTKRVKHWVQLSSVGAYGTETRGLITEESPTSPITIYEKTKTESDQMVMIEANLRSFSFSILRPSNVYGIDMSNSSLFQMISMINRGLFFFIGKPGAIANYIHVDNVVDALLLCGSLPEASGQVFNLSDQCTMEKFVSMISQALSVREPRLRIPEIIVRAAAGLVSWIPGIPLTTSRINALTNRAIYPSDKIIRQLGYTHRLSMQDGLNQIISKTKTTRLSI